MVRWTTDPAVSSEHVMIWQQMETAWVVVDKSLTAGKSGCYLPFPWQGVMLWITQGGQICANLPRGIDGSWLWDLGCEEQPSRLSSDSEMFRYHPWPLSHVPSKSQDCCSSGSPVQDNKFQECRQFRWIGASNRTKEQVEAQLLKKHLFPSKAK